MHYYLENIETSVNLGITSEERNTPQKILVSIWFNFDPLQAINSDDIADTVDYQTIYDTVKSFPHGKSWNLLEKLHTDLILELQKRCPAAHDLEISIKKFPWPDGSVTVS